MKKLIFTLCALMLLSSGAIMAQTVDTTPPDRNADAAKRTVENQARAQTERLTELLDLTSEQQTQMIELFTNISERRAQVRNRSAKGDEMAKANMKINSQRERDIVKILTPEQNKAYKASQGQRTP